MPVQFIYVALYALLDNGSVVYLACAC